MHQNQRTKAFVIRTALLLLSLAIWEISAQFKLYDPFFTSYPSEIIRDLATFIMSGDFFYHAGITITEALLGLIIGIAVGLSAGMLLSQFRIAGLVLTPVFSAINSIPQLALAPVYVLWFGLGLKSKVILVGLMVFFSVFFPTYNSILNTNAKLNESAYMLGATKWETLIYVTLPTCMPYIFTGIRAGIGASLVGAIIGEYMGASGGFGWMITYATSYFMIERVMSSILILMAVGVALNKLLDYIEMKVLHWNANYVDETANKKHLEEIKYENQY